MSCDKKMYGESPVVSFSKYVRDNADKNCLQCKGLGIVMGITGGDSCICGCIPKDKLAQFGYLQYGWPCK